MIIDKCPISGSTTSIEYLNLGSIPLVNNLCSTREESLSCKKFPLAIQFFPESKLTCLTETVNKDNLFLNYLYRSGVNKPFVDHCARMYDHLCRIVDFKDKDLVVDIGGNDGTLLLEFRKENRNLHYINIDCSKSFIDVNEQNDIEYINEYFGDGIRLPYKAKLITSTNVFQHTVRIRSFVIDIEKNLSNEGIWCLEFPYILTTLANDNYDQVYHEHVYYYCLGNIVDLLKQEGLKVINVSYYDMHAGTLRILIAKESSWRRPDGTIDSFLNLEKTLTIEYCHNWGNRTYEKIRIFKQFLHKLSKKHTIACFGAAAKGCVFLNTCSVDDSIFKFIIDDTPFKQGKFVPGTGLQVLSRDVLSTQKIDYLLILAHNFKDHIIKSLKNEYSGKFIIMFPDIKIL
jgi:hypothetical protein